ncbi:unnamed protein product [Moneuplotes crassus]|uniref:Uncharacterized protein n=1 Tax=Euplotes crassus TaxID=5936 RepID=A0AAD1Y9G4_EUPCR|nr:unnamed protein product [Moneuplotes crassus]
MNSENDNSLSETNSAYNRFKYSQDELDSQRLKNLLHAQSIKSGKTDFWYKLNNLIDKIKIYKDTFSVVQNSSREPPKRRRRKSSNSSAKDTDKKDAFSREARRVRKFLPTVRLRKPNFLVYKDHHMYKKSPTKKKLRSGSYRSSSFYSPVRKKSMCGALDPSYFNPGERHGSKKNVIFDVQKAAVPSIKPNNSTFVPMLSISNDHEHSPPKSIQKIPSIAPSITTKTSAPKLPINEALSESSYSSNPGNPTQIKTYCFNRKEKIKKNSYQLWKENRFGKMIHEKMVYKEHKDDSGQNKPKVKYFDKKRLSRLSKPRKYPKLKIKRNRRKFNISHDVRQDFPEISSNRSKVELKDTIVNAQKAQIFGCDLMLDYCVKKMKNVDKKPSSNLKRKIKFFAKANKKLRAKVQPKSTSRPLDLLPSVSNFANRRRSAQ